MVPFLHYSPPKTCVHFFTFPHSATYPTHPIHLYLITRTVLVAWILQKDVLKSEILCFTPRRLSAPAATVYVCRPPSSSVATDAPCRGDRDPPTEVSSQTAATDIKLCLSETGILAVTSQHKADPKNTERIHTSVKHRTVLTHYGSCHFVFRFNNYAIVRYDN